MPCTAVDFLKHSIRHNPVVNIAATMLVKIMPMIRAILLLEGGSSEGVSVSGVLSDIVEALVGVIGGPVFEIKINDTSFSITSILFHAIQL